MKIITLTTPQGSIRADGQRAFSLAIPLTFDGQQPSAFGAPPATAAAFQSGDFVGDVALGGSCNCKEYRLIPHCNGTHTECVGHVTREAVNVNEVLSGGLEPAVLLSIATLTAGSCAEDSDPVPQPTDRLITAQAIETAWRRQPWQGVAVSALALRTLPNHADKKHRRYGEIPPPYLTRQAVQLLIERGIVHLLLDVPSMDRTEDQGLLTAHRLFWGLPAGGTALATATRPRATVTELLFAEDSVPDGRYLLDLQLAPFVADAVPSRPLFYPVLD